MIGTSSVARGLSVYLDALIDNKMSNFFQNLFPMHVNFLAPYPDFFSLIVVLLLSGLLAVGVKESSILNNVFTVINLATIIIVIISGAIKGKSNLLFLKLFYVFFSTTISVYVKQFVRIFKSYMSLWTYYVNIFVANKKHILV